MASDMEQPQQQEYGEPQKEQGYEFHRCAFDPEVETALACGKCGKYICPRCMIQTPVGSRCRECTTLTRHPTFDVNSSYYVRAAAAGGAVGIGAGLAWGLLISVGIPFVSMFLAAGVGYVIGETVSVVTNRKRGTRAFPHSRGEHYFSHRDHVDSRSTHLHNQPANVGGNRLVYCHKPGPITHPNTSQ